MWVNSEQRSGENINITNPLQFVVYVLGNVAGIYFGSALEERIALGHSTIHVIIDNEEGKNLAEVFRQEGFGLKK